MLSFLSPLFLFAAAAAAVPVVLHFLNKQPEARVKFSATMFSVVLKLPWVIATAPCPRMAAPIFSAASRA